MKKLSPSRTSSATATTGHQFIDSHHQRHHLRQPDAQGNKDEALNIDRHDEASHPVITAKTPETVAMVTSPSLSSPHLLNGVSRSHAASVSQAPMQPWQHSDAKTSTMKPHIPCRALCETVEAAVASIEGRGDTFGQPTVSAPVLAGDCTIESKERSEKQLQQTPAAPDSLAPAAPEPLNLSGK